jgi:hypothetical protein
MSHKTVEVRVESFWDWNERTGAERGHRLRVVVNHERILFEGIFPNRFFLLGELFRVLQENLEEP